MEEINKIKLSKSILDMKFMKRSKEKVQKEREDAEGQEMYSSEITEEMKRNGNILFREASITFCKNLVDGHLSFGGVNPEIEKLMKNYYKSTNKGTTKMEVDVTDEQMAQQYSSTVETVGNRFKPKRQKRKSTKN